MDLTINYNHEGRNNGEVFGSTKERLNEINALFMTAAYNAGLQSKSEEMEWVLSQLKDLKPCDLILVGLLARG